MKPPVCRLCGGDCIPGQVCKANGPKVAELRKYMPTQKAPVTLTPIVSKGYMSASDPHSTVSAANAPSLNATEQHALSVTKPQKQFRNAGGRPPKGEKAQTAAEKQRAYRARRSRSEVLSEAEGKRDA